MTDFTASLDLGLKLAEAVAVVFGAWFASVKIGRLSGRFESVFEQYGKDIHDLKDATEEFNAVINKMALHASDISELKRAVVKLTDMVGEIAVQKNRLDNQAERMTRIERMQDEMRRGEGLIVHHGAE